jgi:hypothetical protein
MKRRRVVKNVELKVAHAYFGTQTFAPHSAMATHGLRITTGFCILFVSRNQEDPLTQKVRCNVERCVRILNMV